MDDIGAAVGLRGASLYRHIASKQDIVEFIMTRTMTDLLDLYAVAVGTTDDVVEKLKRATESHVRYRASHRKEAFVGNREIRSLEEPRRRELLKCPSE